MDRALTMVDDNFAKKIETDALTKAISKLGFNADIFLGKFDDVRYVAEMNAEFNKVERPDYIAKMNNCKTLLELQDVFLSIKGATIEEIKLKDKLKTTLK
jgi:hypothetical protein